MISLLVAAVILGYLYPRSLIVVSEDEPDLIDGNAVTRSRWYANTAVNCSR